MPCRSALLPGLGNAEGMRASSGVIVSVGNRVGVEIVKDGVTETGVSGVRAFWSTGVADGCAFGGFRKVYMNPKATAQSPINPQPRPIRRKISSVPKEILRVFIGINNCTGNDLTVHIPAIYFSKK